jgi:hypothetical protein
MDRHFRPQTESRAHAIVDIHDNEGKRTLDFLAFSLMWAAYALFLLSVR